MRTRAIVLLATLSPVPFALALGACGAGDDTVTPATVEAGSDATSDAAHEGGGSEGGAAEAGGSEGGGGSGDGATTDAPSDAGTAPDGDASQTAVGLQHIFYIMMENHSFSEIIGSTATANAPYLNMLAGQYGVAANYYGVTHPSLPNYLAAISGDFQGIWDDCAAGPTVTCSAEEFVTTATDNTKSQLLTPGEMQNAAIVPHWFSGRNLVDQLEEHGMTWVAYMQGIAGVGDTSEYWPYFTPPDAGPEAGVVAARLYAQKHDPFMYFQDIRTNTNRMQKIVPFTQFATDIAGSTVPNFVWISPDQCHDMHGVSTVNAAYLGIAGCDVDSTAIKLGDDFIKDTVGKIMASPAWKDASAIVIAWDEDDYAGYAGCCNSPTGADGGLLGGAKAPALVITSKNPKAQMSMDPYNHYSLLATIQHLWGLDCLANTCGMTGSALMTKLFVP